MVNNYRLLPREDVLRVSDVAFYHMTRLRTPETQDLPLRVVARIRTSLPAFLDYSLGFETQWQSGRDLYCRSNEIDFVIDRISARRMRGCTIHWEGDEVQGGFRFENPAWPPSTPETHDPNEEYDATLALAAPAATGEPSASDRNFTSKGIGIGGALAMMLLVLVIRFGTRMAGEGEQRAKENQARQAALNTALEQEGQRLQEKMRRGEDIDDALLEVLGMDPAQYKRYQAAVLRAKELAENAAARQGELATDAAPEENAKAVTEQLPEKPTDQPVP
ncbi:MAG: hypothetical protein IT423_03470 [Pirellulaceae bacterium]|nr:hypothetical protein [Pirellulaceae bacterium]